MTEIVPPQILDEMKTYYQERAAEYDEWFYRKGRYDRSPGHNAIWFAEVDTLFAVLDSLHLQGDILELAPGTGNWTERLVRSASSLTAVDASDEMIAINRAKVNSDRVSYMQADLFSWQPELNYDAVCFCFWLSHVPVDRLDAFLGMVARATRPGGTIFFADSLREQTSTAADHQLPGEEQQIMTRKLNDGRAFQIVKNFYDPAFLAARCEAAGFTMTVGQTPNYFLYGHGIRR